METTTPILVPFGWHFAEELSHSPSMGQATKTQSPVWTDNKGDGQKPGGGEMDWYADTDDTDDLPKEKRSSNDNPPQKTCNAETDVRLTTTRRFSHAAHWHLHSRI
jgi:hypothetical protein